MRKMQALILAVGLGVFLVSSVMGATVMVQLSGPGAVDESTIRVGQPVSVDIFIENDTIYTGFTMGFKVTSPDIKSIEHLADSAKGINKRGNIKGHNGWQGKEVWDLGGVYVVDTAFDGVLPDTLGFGGLCVKHQYTAHESEKKLSFDMVVPTAGTLVIDSSFFPPGGKWLFSAPARYGESTAPVWKGPYKFKVIK